MNKGFNDVFLSSNSQICSAKQLVDENNRMEQIKTKHEYQRQELMKNKLEKERIESARYQESLRISRVSIKISIFSAIVAALSFILALLSLK